MRRWVFVLSAAALLVVACGRDVQPEAAAEPTRWDPCNITPEQIAATGLDPDYRDEGWDEGIKADDWARCSFKPPGVDVAYHLSVRSSLLHTFSSVRQDSLAYSLRDVRVADRDAFVYQRSAGESLNPCSIGLDVPPGVVVFTVSYFVSSGDKSDPCARVLKHASDLQTALPPVAK
ncbi:hypothetical protein RhoFasB10_01017 [Rhodococcus sp. B10]|nr:hypothetical protein [Rhodococcus sp. B10]